MSAAIHHPLTNCQRQQSQSAAAGVSFGRTLRLWRARIRERHAFPVPDERELRDLRLSRWDFERELAKPFWRG